MENNFRVAPRLASSSVARPSSCPSCGVPAHPLGGHVQLVGHGLRSRKVRAALTPDDPVIELVISVCRYVCRSCGTAWQVLPAEITLPARYNRQGTRTQHGWP